MKRNLSRIGTSLLLGCLAWQVPVQAGAASRYKLVVQPATKHVARDRINVGDTYKEKWTATCYDSDGNEVDDIVHFTAEGGPTSGDAKTQWIPEVGRTFEPSLLKISTTTKTKPGVYTLSVVASGEKCGTAPPVVYPLEVAPLISGDATLWWFDGASPANYKTKGTLKALPADNGPYKWTVKQGKDKVRFSDGSSDTSTDTESIKYKSTGPNGSKPEGSDVQVVVTVNGVQSDPLVATVKVPHRLQPLSSTSEVEPDFGYVTVVAYQIYDQMGKPLPKGVFVELNEKFTTDVIKDRLDSDWIRGEPGGNLQDPKFMNDRITGQAWPSTPAALKPIPPLGKKKIHHFSGEWRIGSTAVGQGRKVQSNDWQRYQDHAAHENVVSPVQR